jgi:hypothetical protein
MAKQKKVRLLVGTKKGAFVLTASQERKKWDLTGPVLKGAEVNDIVCDVRDEPTLYACVNSYWWGSNVHSSKDWGKTWNKPEVGVQFEKESGKMIARTWSVKPGLASQPNVLFVGVDPGALFKSKDNGQTWKELKSLSEHPTKKLWMPGAGGLMVHSIVSHPTDTARMAVGISAADFFATNDSGKSWEAHNKNVLVNFKPESYPEAGQCVHHLESHPSKPNVFYQQNHCGVYRSDDEGKDWVDISEGLPSRFGFPIQIHPYDPDTVFVIPEQGPEFRASARGALAVYQSSNRGATWKKASKGLPEKPSFLHVHRQAMTHDELDAFGLYVGTTSGQIY